MKTSSTFEAGEWVEVRSKSEILKTLDERGQLDGLPFMPEMFQFCGQRFRVFKRAHKTCDPPSGLEGRSMPRAVHLDGLRCSGESHGGCQARCLIFWKNAWLKKVDDGCAAGEAEAPPILTQANGGACTEEDVLAAARQGSCPDTEQPAYVCQSTQLARATRPLPRFGLHYIEDWTSGNVRLSQLVASAVFTVLDSLANAGLGFGSFLKWAYDATQRIRGGTPYPCRTGRVARGERTPSARLDLRPGEMARVRPYEDILETIDETGHNRGMFFDAEMVPYCGGTYRVLDRVSRIINEKTGRIQQLKNECLILDEVVCQACYARNRRFCSRSIYPFWREIWLERTSTRGAIQSEAQPRPVAGSGRRRSG